ncbi:MAG TPA: LuxR C-terminal-related transcriptional regulator [Polyangiaceae bacterium]|nr:LuxR C-terminal-related transcriptional regulator [Polyangiaceae bacterium]
MTLLQTPAAIDVISRIYSAALDVTAWPATVAALTEWIGGEIGCLQLRRFGPQPTVSIVASGCDRVFESAYLEHYHRLDPHLSRVGQLPQGRTVLSREVLSDEELFSSEFYNDFFRPQGVCDLQGAMLLRSPSRVVTFVTQSSLRERYDGETRARLDAIVPHLTRAVEFVLRAEEVDATQSALLAIGEVEHTGLLRVSASLAVVEARESTLAWLSRRCGALSVIDGQLLARDAGDAEQLRSCVSSALAQATARCVLNADPAESVRLVASAAPPSPLFPEPSVILFFSVQPRAGSRSCDAAVQLDALSPALRSVAEALALGWSDKEIADRLQLPLATARTYVSRTLRRLGATSRRELMLRR